MHTIDPRSNHAMKGNIKSGVGSAQAEGLQWPRVLIVILNWNGLPHTMACLASLDSLAYPAYDVLVIDNGSRDDSLRSAKDLHPQVRLIFNQHNLGFAGGCNVGLQYAIAEDYDYVLLLNNDTTVAPDFLRHMIQEMQADPGLGISGPTICFQSDPQIIWSAGGEIDWTRGNTRMQGLEEVDRGQYGRQVREVDFVTGCAFLVRQDLVRKVGLFDERYFAYYEEVDYCLRARAQGYQIKHVPLARIFHDISLSGQSLSPTVHYYMTRNRLLFLRKHKAEARAWLHTLLKEYARTLISWSIRPKWRDRRTLRSAMWQAVCDAFRGKWGKKPAG